MTLYRATSQGQVPMTPAEEAAFEASRAPLPPSVAAYESAVQNMLDAKAQAFGYDDIKSACTYAGDPDPTFNDQGTKLKNWRSACWRACYNVMPQVQGGFRSQPSIADLLAMMPPSPL